MPYTGTALSHGFFAFLLVSGRKDEEIMRKLTFNKLLHKINLHASKLPKTPTAKYLRENAGTPLLQTEDGIITVYSNGYAIYKNERQTVLWIADCASFTYHFVSGNKEVAQACVINIEVLGGQPWDMVLTLAGEEQLRRNLLNSPADRTGTRISFHDNDDKNTDGMKLFTTASPDPLATLLYQETIQEQLEKLTDIQKTVFTAYHVLEYSQKEIAMRLGIAQQTVSRHLRAAKRKLRK